VPVKAKEFVDASIGLTWLFLGANVREVVDRCFDRMLDVAQKFLKDLESGKIKNPR